MIALPGSRVLKKVRSSSVTLEKGSLSGAAAGDGEGSPVPAAWNIRYSTPCCPKVKEARGRQRRPGARRGLAVAGAEERLL